MSGEKFFFVNVFWEKFLKLICNKRNDDKCTGNVEYPFMEWKLLLIFWYPRVFNWPLYIPIKGHLATDFFIWKVYVKFGRRVFQISYDYLVSLFVYLSVLYIILSLPTLFQDSFIDFMLNSFGVSVCKLFIY